MLECQIITPMKGFPNPKQFEKEFNYASNNYITKCRLPLKTLYIS